MIYIKAYTRVNLGDDLLIKIVCNNNKEEKFCILGDESYKDIFKDIENLEILVEDYNVLQNLKNNREEFIDAHDKFIKKISNICDTFLYVGGSIFIDGGPSSIIRLGDLRKEISSFTNSYIIGANFGPCYNKEYFDFVHDKIIPLLNHITFRDIESYNSFKDLGNVSYAPDIVFSLNTNKVCRKNKEIGISLIYHLNRDNLKDNYYNYLNYIKRIAKEYIKDGYKLRLLSFCEYEKDPIAINDFLNLLSAEEKRNISIDYYKGNINEFLEIFESLDTIIATRFHSIVLALKYNCKVIPICYSNKSENLLKDLNIKDYITFSNIKNIDNFRLSNIDNKLINKFELDSFKHFDYKKTIR